MNKTSQDLCAHSPIADILKRVSDELQMIAVKLGDICLPVEDALSHQDGVRYPPFIRAMQELDYMRQAVAGIGDFLQCLSKDTPENWRLDPKLSAMVVTLSHLADRLGAQEAPLLPQLCGAEGECEFF